MVNDDDYDLVSESSLPVCLFIPNSDFFQIHKYLKQMVISPILLEFIFFLDQQLYNLCFISPYCYPKELCRYLIKHQRIPKGQ